jgi:hypothetical protein
MDIILIIAMVLLVVVLLTAGLFLVSKFKPELLSPVAKRVAKTKTGKKQIAKTISNQDLDSLEESLSSQLGREQARKITSVMAKKSPAAREQMITELLESAEKGVMPNQNILEKSKTKDQGRAKEKKRQAARRKRKQAKKQRRKK